MIQTILLHIFGSFVGTVAFAVLFNVPRRFYLCCGLTGTARVDDLPDADRRL